MVSGLQGRIDRIEQEAAPLIERRRERLHEIAKLRAYIQPDIDEVMQLAKYCQLPNLQDIRAGIESDWIEQEFLALAEYNERFGVSESTKEKRIEAIIESDIKFYREIYGLGYSRDDVLQPRITADRVREDIKNKVPLCESEAAQLIIEAERTRAARLKKHTDAFAAFIAGADSRIPDWVFSAE
jgi:hypothetical protein